MLETIVPLAIAISTAILAWRVYSSVTKSMLLEKSVTYIALDIDKGIANSYVEFNELLETNGLSEDIVKKVNGVRGLL